MANQDVPVGRWLTRMVGRDRSERHRVASTLELFFDLCFVGAVSQAADQLDHAMVSGHAGQGILRFALVFFAIWWAWMNFTWFASAYDTDDVLYRITVLVQIAGALIMAAGVPAMINELDLSIGVAGYVVMRLALVTQWLRAAHGDPAGRRTAIRYAVGVAVVQVGWLVVINLPHALLVPGIVVFGVAELAVPVWAERARSTPWHPHHVAERYGLFTLIVLGESVLAATNAVQSALAEGGGGVGLYTLAGGGLLIVFAMWWIYFAVPVHGVLRSTREALPWGYGHYLIFASAAAVGAGMGVAIAADTGEAHISRFAAGAAVTVPVALYLLTVWALHVRPVKRGLLAVASPPVAVVLVLLATFTGSAVLVAGLVMAALVAVNLVFGHRPAGT
jgi:low temperature requirement protein LtrA